MIGSEIGSPALAALFIALAAAIAVVGTALTRKADAIADRTGFGEALVGAVLLGGATSLSELAASVGAAWSGYPRIAVSNAVGGIAAQTAFLAIADIFYRRANLEHASASTENLSIGALLLTLLAIPIAAFALPDVTFWGVHPATAVLILGYVGGLRLAGKARAHPMWIPRQTDQTVKDVPAVAPAGREQSAAPVYGSFLLLSLALAASGYAIGEVAIAIFERTALEQAAVGGFFLAIATSLPELVTTIAAVRNRCLTLAVGGVLGGNAFDTLLLGFSDMAYREGSIYHSMAMPDVAIIAVTSMMSGVLLLGLLSREREGIGRIGFESALVLVLYASAVLVMF